MKGVFLTGHINIRVTLQERKEIQEQASVSGLSLSEYVRRRILGRRVVLSHRLNTGKKSKVIFLDRITSFDKNLEIFFQLFNRLGNIEDRSENAVRIAPSGRTIEIYI